MNNLAAAFNDWHWQIFTVHFAITPYFFHSWGQEKFHISAFPILLMNLIYALKHLNCQVLQQ